MMSFRGDRFSSLPLPTEREIFGYRHALNLIHTNAGSLSIAPGVLRQFHQTIQEDSGDAGHLGSP